MQCELAWLFYQKEVQKGLEGYGCTWYLPGFLLRKKEKSSVHTLLVSFQMQVWKQLSDKHNLKLLIKLHPPQKNPNKTHTTQTKKTPNNNKKTQTPQNNPPTKKKTSKIITHCHEAHYLTTNWGALSKPFT